MKWFAVNCTALCISLLMGCAHEKIVYVPQEVKVPVPVPCVAKMPAKPLFPLDDLGFMSLPVFDKVTAALFEIELRRQYETELEISVKNCTKL